MSNVVIQRAADNDWEVWMTVDVHDPLNELNDVSGFIIGNGDTVHAAIADAIRDLESVLKRLQRVPMTSAQG